MKGNYPLSRVRLHRALLELLAHPEVFLELAPMRDGGRAHWDDITPPTNIRIKVDANAGEQVRFVIHELLHIILHPMFIGHVDNTLEEVCVVALDTYFGDYVMKSPKRLAKWTALIAAKLDEHMVPVPLAEQVERNG